MKTATKIYTVGAIVGTLGFTAITVMLLNAYGNNNPATFLFTLFAALLVYLSGGIVCSAGHCSAKVETFEKLADGNYKIATITLVGDHKIHILRTGTGKEINTFAVFDFPAPLMTEGESFHKHKKDALRL